MALPTVTAAPQPPGTAAQHPTRPAQHPTRPAQHPSPAAADAPKAFLFAPRRRPRGQWAGELRAARLRAASHIACNLPLASGPHPSPLSLARAPPHRRAHPQLDPSGTFSPGRRTGAPSTHRRRRRPRGKASLARPLRAARATRHAPSPRCAHVRTRTRTRTRTRARACPVPACRCLPRACLHVHARTARTKCMYMPMPMPASPHARQAVSRQ